MTHNIAAAIYIALETLGGILKELGMVRLANKQYKRYIKKTNQEQAQSTAKMVSIPMQHPVKKDASTQKGSTEKISTVKKTINFVKAKSANSPKTIAQYIPLLSFTPVKVSLQLTMMLMQRIQFQYVD